MSQQAQSGHTVKVHYTGRLPSGAVFDSTENREPLEFRLGEQRVIPGFEAAIVGMRPGESKQATIPADDAYGPHRDELVVEIDRQQVPEDMQVEVGNRLQLQTTDGQPIPATVTEVGPASIKVDANHPLAGQDLMFEVELVEIVPSVA